MHDISSKNQSPYTHTHTPPIPLPYSYILESGEYIASGREYWNLLTKIQLSSSKDRNIKLNLFLTSSFPTKESCSQCFYPVILPTIFCLTSSMNWGCPHFDFENSKRSPTPAFARGVPKFRKIN